jgi:hypothetical protein
MNNLNFDDLSLYLEEEFQYKMVKFISHRELHTEYFEIYFRIFDSSNVYSEFIDSEDYKQWLIKRKRIENINKII